MATATATVSSATSSSKTRTVLIASADDQFRNKLAGVLSHLRWHVREAHGGAEAWGETMDSLPRTIIVDSWLPDLDVNEFLREFHNSFPTVNIVTNGAASHYETGEGPFHGEILYALRKIQDTDTAAWNTAPSLDDPVHHSKVIAGSSTVIQISKPRVIEMPTISQETTPVKGTPSRELCGPANMAVNERLPELVGNASCMLDVSRRICRVAPRVTPVLIEGPTGSEIVAQALHRLSHRCRRPFVALNCAAIPEALLEAELFGHTRGAFTGAVQGRMGRIEAANGGTLFLDEIGEMPLGLQAKLLRFVESGELQRVGDNETVKVDVRIVAATHRALAKRAQAGDFRADLYYRLAVFLIRTPALTEHIEDLPLLVDHFLERMGRAMPVKRIDDTAMTKLRAHSWRGNVRELEHVLERAAILSGDNPVLSAADIDFGAELD